MCTIVAGLRCRGLVISWKCAPSRSKSIELATTISSKFMTTFVQLFSLYVSSKTDLIIDLDDAVPRTSLSNKLLIIAKTGNLLITIMSATGDKEIERLQIGQAGEAV